jgi:hypothetical protein
MIAGRGGSASGNLAGQGRRLVTIDAPGPSTGSWDGDSPEVRTGKDNAGGVRGELPGGLPPKV